MKYTRSIKQIQKTMSNKYSHTNAYKRWTTYYVNFMRGAQHANNIDELKTIQLMSLYDNGIIFLSKAQKEG
jgi:hypothetical protein